MLSLLYLVVKAKIYFVSSSCMFLDEKTVLEIWLNPGLNLTIFRGTRLEIALFSHVVLFCLFVFNAKLMHPVCENDL